VDACPETWQNRQVRQWVFHAARKYAKKSLKNDPQSLSGKNKGFLQFFQILKKMKKTFKNSVRIPNVKNKGFCMI
jgi:hypothetical protein